VNPKALVDLGERTLSKRGSLVNLWQDIAMNFYPERADFTYQRALGTEFAANIVSSYPIICRRDLGNQFSTMLRPTEKTWFEMQTVDERLNRDNEIRACLEYFGTVMRRAMYDRMAKFNQATKEGDHDFAAFGQTVISGELGRYRDALLYRSWHLKDCAWLENSERDLGAIFRRWKPYICDLRRLFPKTTQGPRHVNLERQDPYTEVNCMHLVVEAEMFDGAEAKNKPYVSIFYDIDNDTPLEVLGVWNQIYVIPRWQTVSGSQYSFSPATVAALPESRLLQAMTYTLLEAGEKMTSPPYLANQNVIRGDMGLYAGGFVWADIHEGSVKDAMMPLVTDKSGMPIGIEMQKDSKEMILKAFYLDTLKPFNPTTDPEMTAFQAGQIVQDYIRKALPLFEPMEASYNGGLCELTFDVLLRNGAFGAPDSMPRRLRQVMAGEGKKAIQFRFKSPLHDSIDQLKGQLFLQAKQLTAEAVGLDPAAGELLKATDALRDALQGIGVPAAWTRSEEEVKKMSLEAGAAADAQHKLDLMQKGADVAATMAKARPNSPAAAPIPA
jgi:hypothetical protein